MVIGKMESEVKAGFRTGGARGNFGPAHHAFFIAQAVPACATI
jgi:hypothetical protein